MIWIDVVEPGAGMGDPKAVHFSVALCPCYIVYRRHCVAVLGHIMGDTLGYARGCWLQVWLRGRCCADPKDLKGKNALHSWLRLT